MLLPETVLVTVNAPDVNRTWTVDLSNRPDHAAPVELLIAGAAQEYVRPDRVVPPDA